MRSNNYDFTEHEIYYNSSNNMKEVDDESVALVVTSPPYPMIEMWDSQFQEQIKEESDRKNRDNEKWQCDIKESIHYAQDEFQKVFFKQHKILSYTWTEIERILIHGGICCINIGNATRSFNKNFSVFQNNQIIIRYFQELGFHCLPEILWVKPQNSPNKFLGSGMLPPNAYITNEHEYILIFRKIKKREFKKDYEKIIRRRSAFFWEERNIWFSDIWKIAGANQKLDYYNKRSGAFPLEIAHRLINMFSIKHDIILDPFLGTGTTMIASMINQRNFVGYEINQDLKQTIDKNLSKIVEISNKVVDNRLKSHRRFIESQIDNTKTPKYDNIFHNFKVKTKNETELCLKKIKGFTKNQNNYEIEYTKV
jgi:DNA modification methylase